MIFGRLATSFLVALLLTVLTSLSFAQEKVPTPTPTPPKPVEYVLPYPGILPDHPLYFLKMARDRILFWFITDPLRKAEFNLLQADKRLNSGLALLSKENYALAESTLSKGGKYLEQVVVEIEKAQKVGKDTDALTSKLSLAALKHQEVLSETLEKLPESNRTGVQDALERAQKVTEWVKETQKKKLEKRLQEKILGRNFSSVRVEAKEK